MIFQRITIHNLFSYRDAVFDLSGASAQRNIALISGRNGYGKTSFINAIKLLFVGPDDSLCSAVQEGRTLKPKEYVLGLGEDWMGIMNRQARLSGDQHCEVRIQWHEESSEVEVCRRWELGRDRYQETLEVDIRGDSPQHMEGDDAQQFIGERLPEDYLPFFFYDGEQIQRLAEATRSQQIKQMERLLNISKIETLLEYLDKTISGWRKGAMPSNELHRLTQLEGELADFEAHQAALHESAASLQGERVELERRINEEDRYLEGRHSSRQSQDETHLQGERKRLEAALETAQTGLLDTLIPAAPLLVNPALVTTVIVELQKIVNNAAGNQAQALREVLTDLPYGLFDKPPASTPPLTDGQIRFYKHRLTSLVSAYISSPEDFLDGPLRLDAGHAQELMSLFQYYQAADQERRDRATDLRNITTTKRQLKDVQRRLDDVSSLSPEEQQEHRQRKAANDERKQRVGAINNEQQYNRKQVKDLQNQIEAKQKEVRSQERQVRLSEQARTKVDQAERAREFFFEYKEALRKDKREALEQAVNRRFAQLMTSHRMIKRVEIDDHFGLHFIDQGDQAIAMGSLSAGMKQLAATALLWGLKEVSGKALPLVIDTPLARIDRAHQENLLTRYYPHAAEQVIVLPTDSELDAEKYALLAPHIYREYRLENPDGDNTRVESAEMYTNEAEVAHG